MSEKDGNSDYLDPYREAVRKHGPTFEGLLWRNPEFQKIRFRVLVETVELGLKELGLESLERTTIADLGCGRADLFEWIRANGKPCRSYIGVDGVPDLIQACQDRAERHAWDTAHFQLADFVADDTLYKTLADHGVSVMLFSGSLNTMDDHTALDVIDRAARALSHTRGPSCVAFNFLSAAFSSEPPPPEDPAKRFHPAKILEHCLGLSPNVLMRHDYLGGRDATVAVFLP